MKMRLLATGLSAVSVTLAVLVLTGCVAPFGAPEEGRIPTPTLDFDRFSEKSLRPAVRVDEAPLRIGAWWSYRDATADHLPTWRPGAGREDRVLCTVDGGDGRECFVISTRYPDGSEETRYVYRVEDGWILVARDVGSGVGRLEPAAALLRLPFGVGGSPWQWSYDLGDRVIDVQLIFREMVSVVGGVFPECQKLKLWRMDAGGCFCHSSAEAEFLWYATGCGLVKWVTGSRSYELSASSFTSTERTHVVHWEDRGGTVVADPGERLFVQLPVAWDAPHRWIATVDVDGVLILDDESTTRDLDATGAPLGAYGSYVAVFHVAADSAHVGAVTLRLEYGLPGAAPAHVFETELVVR
ncbi:MAG: hypothetical protein JSW65_03130 [Candidatus Bipolaricaulota bacterium]|nr:MAG: hypothetical protein JSW65_03130 [Candidatus Bipolaricaulota bacterium]